MRQGLGGVRDGAKRRFACSGVLGEAQGLGGVRDGVKDRFAGLEFGGRRTGRETCKVGCSI